MAMIPPAIVAVWLSGLLSLGLISGGAALIWAWYRDAWVYNALLDRVVFARQLGLNWPTALLALGISLLVWAFAGGLLLRLAAALKPRSERDDAQPDHRRDGEVFRLKRPDGTVLQVESYGPADAPPLILTHGWGTTSTEWHYLKRQLGQRFRLIVWDLPGVGRSTRPRNQDYSLDAFADHLDAVLRFAGKPAILVGHSIGGMTILTFCKRFPASLGTQVLGLVLVHTTYINPVRTARFGRLFTALERPLIVPLLHLTIGLSPLVLLMNWLSYLNGSLQVANYVSGFVGANCWPKVDFCQPLQSNFVAGSARAGNAWHAALRRSPGADPDSRPNANRPRRPRPGVYPRGKRVPPPAHRRIAACSPFLGQTHGPYGAQSSIYRAGGDIRRSGTPAVGTASRVSGGTVVTSAGTRCTPASLATASSASSPGSKALPVAL